MLDGKAPTIFGDGKQTQDFVYVEDVARANLLAMDAAASDLANIGTGVEMSVNDIFRHLAKLTGFRGAPIYAAARPGEVYRIALNPSQAKQWLGWTPHTRLRGGVQKTEDLFWRHGTATPPPLGPC